MSRSLSSSRSKPYDRPARDARTTEEKDRNAGSSFFGSILKRINPFASGAPATATVEPAQDAAPIQQQSSAAKSPQKPAQTSPARPRVRGSTPHSTLQLGARHPATSLDNAQALSGSSHASSVFGANAMPPPNLSVSPSRGAFNRNASPFRSPSLSALNLYSPGTSISPTDSSFGHQQRQRPSASAFSTSGFTASPGRSLLFPTSPSLSSLSGPSSRKRNIDQITTNDYKGFSPPLPTRGHSPLNPSYTASSHAASTRNASRVPYSPMARQRHRNLARDSSVASIASLHSHTSSVHSVDSSGRPRKKQMTWDPVRGFIATEELERRSLAEHEESDSAQKMPRNEAERILNELESMRGARSSHHGLASPQSALASLPRSQSAQTLRPSSSASASFTYNFGTEQAPLSPHARKSLYDAQRHREARLSPINHSHMHDEVQVASASSTEKPNQQPELAGTRSRSRRKRETTIENEAQVQHKPHKESDAEASTGRSSKRRSVRAKVASPTASVSGREEDTSHLRRSTRQAQKRRQESEEPSQAEEKSPSRKRSPAKTRSNKSSSAKQTSARTTSKGKGKAPEPIVEEPVEENAESMVIDEAVSAVPKSSSRANPTQPLIQRQSTPSSSPRKTQPQNLIEAVVKPARKPKLTGDEEKMLARSSKRSARGMFGATAEDLQLDDELGATDIDGLEKIQMPEFKLPDNFKFASNLANVAVAAPVTTAPHVEESQTTSAAPIKTTHLQTAPADSAASTRAVSPSEEPTKSLPTPSFSFSKSDTSPATQPEAKFSFSPAKAEVNGDAPKFSFAPASSPAVSTSSSTSPAPFAFGPSKTLETDTAAAQPKPFSFVASSSAKASEPEQTNSAFKPVTFAQQTAKPALLPEKPAETSLESAKSATNSTASEAPRSVFTFSPAKTDDSAPSPFKPSKPPAFTFTPSTPDLNAASATSISESASRPASTSPFSFGQQTTAAASASASAPTSSNNTAAGNIFGAKLTSGNSSEVKTTASTPFTFGAKPVTATQGSSTSPFSFASTSKPDASAPQSGFSFGASTAAPSTGFPTAQANTSSGFASTAATGFPASTSPSPFQFGNSSTATGFGQSSSSSTGFGGAPSAFGSQATKGFPSVSASVGFGQAPLMTPAGSADSTTSAPSPFQFGATNGNTNASTGFAFSGGNQSNAAPSPFGSAPTSSAASPFQFNAAPPAASQPSPFQFGQNLPVAPSAGAAVFGQSPLHTPGLMPNGSATPLFNMGSGGGEAPARSPTGNRKIKRLPTGTSRRS